MSLEKTRVRYEALRERWKYKYKENVASRKTLTSRKLLKI